MQAAVVCGRISDSELCDAIGLPENTGQVNV